MDTKKLFNLLIAFLYGGIYSSALWYFIQSTPTTNTQMQILQVISLLVIIFGSGGLIVFIMLFIATIYKEN